MRKLVIAAKAEQDKRDDQGTPLKMDDGRIVTWHRPDPIMMTMMLSTFKGRDLTKASPAEAIDAAITFLDFLEGMLSRDDWEYMSRRIRRPSDPLTLEVLMGEVTALFEEEWVGRPTEPSSSSSTSPRKTGRKSTAPSKRKASTPSDSDSTNSAT